MPDITGYRELSPQEIELVNTAKQLENGVGLFFQMLYAEVKAGADHDTRWLTIARTDFQKAFMSLNRAIARPDSVL